MLLTRARRWTHRRYPARGVNVVEPAVAGVLVQTDTMNKDKHQIYSVALNDTHPKVGFYRRLANYLASGMLSREYFARFPTSLRVT